MDEKWANSMHSIAATEQGMLLNAEKVAVEEEEEEEDGVAVALLVPQEAFDGPHEDATSRRSKFNYEKFDWRAPGIILGFVCLESLGFNGIAANIVIYLGSVLRESNASIATSVTTWTGTGFFTPFLGALIADSYLGSYKTILYSSLIYLAGMLLVILSAFLQLSKTSCIGSSCSSAYEAKIIIFYSGLYLIAFGSGGVKSSLLPLGADQFDDDDPIQKTKKGSFFNWFYFCVNFGALTASTLLVWIEENVGWAVGYGISTLCLALAITSFLVGTSTYRLREPEGSPLKRIFQVLYALLFKFKLRVPEDSRCLYEIQDTNIDTRVMLRLEHSDQFRFLDKAATISPLDSEEGTDRNPWRLCAVSQVEELKTLLRLFPIWLTSIIFSVAYAQMYTTFVEQGRAMNTKIGSFSIPPASLFAFEVLSVMIWVLLYDKVIVKIANNYSNSEPGHIQLWRMAVGYFLVILAMSVAALLEMKRLKSVQASKRISILWQLPQFFIVGCSEVFCYIGQLEFFYEQGPNTMRSLSTAISLLSISLGNYASALIIKIVEWLTTKGGRPGWIPDNLDEGHLDYFFCWLSGMSLMNFIVYVAFAKRFRLKKIIL